MFLRNGSSHAGIWLLALLLAWGCGDGGCWDYLPLPGSLVWAKRAGGASNEEVRDAAVLSDDSVVVTGYFKGTAVFGQGEPEETQLDSAGEEDVFVACYHPDGGLAWAKRGGGLDTDRLFGTAVFSDDSVVVTGAFLGTATFGQGESSETSLTSAGDRDIFVARYDAHGSLLWVRRAGGVGMDTGYGVAACADDSVVITGRFQDSAVFGQDEPAETSLDCAGEHDVFTARYDTDGSLAWAKRAGGSGLDYGEHVAALADNSVLVVGRNEGGAVFGPGELNETTLASQFTFIARYGADGTLAWAKATGEPGARFVAGATALSDDSAVVTGRFSWRTLFGPGEAN